MEITENIALASDEATLSQLRRLRARGIGSAFDDFGTGYASLSYLTECPLTQIKIDRSYIEKIGKTRILVERDTLGLKEIGLKPCFNIKLQIATHCDD